MGFGISNLVYGGCWVEWREGGGAGLWAVVVGGGCWVGSGFSGLWAVAGQWWLLGQWCWVSAGWVGGVWVLRRGKS